MQNHTNIIGSIPLLAAIAFIVSVGFAPGSIRAQETPEAIRKLAFLEGIWTGEASYVAGGQTTSFTMNITVTKIAGGLGYYATGADDIPGVGTYSESNLFGYDAGKDLVHLFSVTANRGYSSFARPKPIWSVGCRP